MGLPGDLQPWSVLVVVNTQCMLNPKLCTSNTTINREELILCKAEMKKVIAHTGALSARCVRYKCTISAYIRSHCENDVYALLRVSK